MKSPEAQRDRQDEHDDGHGERSESPAPRAGCQARQAWQVWRRSHGIPSDGSSAVAGELCRPLADRCTDREPQAWRRACHEGHAVGTERCGPDAPVVGPVIRRANRMKEWRHEQDGRGHRRWDQWAGGSLGAQPQRRRRLRHGDRGLRPPRGEAATRGRRGRPHRRRRRVGPGPPAGGAGTLRAARARRPHHPPRLRRRGDLLAGTALADAARHRHGSALRPRVGARAPHGRGGGPPRS